MASQRSTKGLQRAELAKRTGCNLETIRYYEQIGLMPEPPRTAGGYRAYDHEHVKRLAFIRRSRELGFSLEEIRSLLRLVDGGNYTCAEVRDMTLQHSAEVRRKIADLRRLERSLKEMAAQCSGDTVPECPIIDVLWREAAAGRDRR
jgi:MerR family mercuric resistance operon transcriptional regulator